MLLSLEAPATPAISEGPLFAVTQAAGALGRRVALRLARRGVAPRLVVGNAGDEDMGGIPRAMTGVQTLFLVSAEASPDSLEQDVVTLAAAADAGVERIVYVSILAAATNATFKTARDDFHTEERARATGASCTFLRPSLYFELLPTLCSAGGVIENSAGDGRVACVSHDDVADVAEVVLAQGDHDGRTYDVTGPVAQTMDQVAEDLTLATGRPISYRARTPEQERSSLSAAGGAEWRVELTVSRSAAVAAGEMDVVSDTVPRLTGHPPQTFSAYLRQHPESCDHIAAA